MSLRAFISFSLTTSIFIISSVLSERSNYKLDTFPHSKLIQDTSSLQSPGQVYGFCNDVFSDPKDVFCKFIYEDDLEPYNSSDHFRVCNFTTQSHVTEDSYSVERKIVTIAPYLAVLTTQKTYIDFKLIDFEWCHVISFKLNTTQQFKFAKVWPQLRRSFDVHAWNPTGNCTRKRPCVFKATALTKTVVVSGANEWIKDTSDVVASLASWIVSKGTHKLIADRFWEGSREKLRVYTTDSRRLVQLLKEYQIEEKNDLPYERAPVSSTYELLTVCSVIKYDMTCSQFSLNGTLKFETNLTIKPKNRLFAITIHNLPEGGFVVITTLCSRKTFNQKSCIEDDQTFQATKINANGRPVGSKEFVQFLCVVGNVFNRIHFFRTRQVQFTQDLEFSSARDDSTIWTNEMCLSLACIQYKGPPVHVKLTMYCYNDTEFVSKNVIV